MTDRIVPALTPEEWANADPTSLHGFDDGGIYVNMGRTIDERDVSGRPAALLALANAALPDDDPRKITREWLNSLRSLAADLPEPELADIANALESYLPPE